MMNSLIDTQFDLAILIALQEIGEPTSNEKIVHKTKTFWQRWKKHSKKQEVTRIRRRLSDLTTRRIVLMEKHNGKVIYFLNPEYTPGAMIDECLNKLFKYVPITIWDNEVLFDCEEIDDHSLIFTLEEIREVILKYCICEYV